MKYVYKLDMTLVTGSGRDRKLGNGLLLSSKKKAIYYMEEVRRSHIKESIEIGNGDIIGDIELVTPDRPDRSFMCYRWTITSADKVTGNEEAMRVFAYITRLEVH